MASPGAALSGARVAVGTGAWATPNLTGRLFGLDPKSNPQASYLARLFGIRDIALALAATQSRTGPSRRLAWQLGILCDAFDAGAALLAGRNGTLPKHAAVMAGATAMVGVGLGVAALQAEE
jgi:hypothetical protein